ncbi:hypothetical protein AFV7_gp14 [Betalipothrixvirus pezzuloense]|uniref:Uncharacterized protein n=1 Tax=Betalipothrixvirus pezzuloense TaxID=346883 RepID=A7WKN3_9VIRU|nr:hypothetical protein AFV7_gp14 [Acidianus filamentous virus 7]CAJ31633.1 hypothetical protein [Acidianus filamentous virus 7]
MQQELNNEISEEELKELIQKAEKNEPERNFILEIETIDDTSNFDWFVRKYSILYGDVIAITLKEKEENYGKTLVRDVAIIPKTREVVIKVTEDSDHEEWKDTYFYVFKSNKGWIQVK